MLAVSQAARAYNETHLNEITTPAASYVTGRVAVLTGLATRSVAEKKELAALSKLGKSLARTEFALKGDFAELAAAAKVRDKLGAAGAAMQASLDTGYLAAGLSLSERAELTQDHIDQLLDPKHLAAVRKRLSAVSSARNRAGQETTGARRAADLVKADAAVTKALATAEKYVVKDRGVELLPPARLRSGDAIDARGGRVAVPRDSGSPIAGASIVLPNGLFQNPVTVTLAPAPSFVGGRDIAAGPAVAVSPDGFPLAVGATLHLPYQLPTGASALDLGVLAKGPPQTTIAPVVARPDGTLSATVTGFSTFQAAIAAPQPGQPGGVYRVQTFAMNTALDVTGHDGQTDRAGVLVGVIDQTVTFRPDHTAAAGTPSSFPVVTRTFTRSGVAHHTDSAQNPLSGSSDFLWAAAGPGRFTFNLPLGTGVDAPSLGVASDDGRVVAWSGRGGNFEFFAVGVKTDGNTITADLAGRWAAVELGVQFLDGATEPFRARWHDALRSFTVSTAGAVAFDAQGGRFETDVTYHTDQADPTQTRAANTLGDGGSETWTVGVNGRLTDAAGLRLGTFDKSAGLLTTVFYDPATKRVALMVAVPQAASSSVVPALYHSAGIDIGTTVGVPIAESSTHDVTPAAGSLDVTSPSAAVLSTDAATRAVYTLTTQLPPASFAWMLTTAPTVLGASATNLALSLDAAGNHRVPADELWFAFATDGRYVLRMTRGEPVRLARGIALGVK